MMISRPRPLLAIGGAVCLLALTPHPLKPPVEPGAPARLTDDGPNQRLSAPPPAAVSARTDDAAGRVDEAATGSVRLAPLSSPPPQAVPDAANVAAQFAYADMPEAATPPLAGAAVSALAAGTPPAGGPTPLPAPGALLTLPPAALTPPRSSAVAILYNKGDSGGLAALAASVKDPGERTALEWAALRADPHASFAALGRFLEAHPAWPSRAWIRDRQEGELAAHPAPAPVVAAFFAAEKPQTNAGKIAAARAASAAGRGDEAARIVGALWREGANDAATEGVILREFGAALTKADDRYRADRLFYAEYFGASTRAAALAGPDALALANARMEASHGLLSATTLRGVPLALRNDPSLLFARIQGARRAGRVYEAATLLSLAPRDRASLVSPDRWWSERRMVARTLLDLDEPRLAFETCDGAVKPDTEEAQVDAAFHAGWIALRFVHDAPAAAERFARAAEAADTPLSIARAAYWQGRAAEDMGDRDAAQRFYERAAAEPIAYYGQLAAQRLGQARLALHASKPAAEGDKRDEAVGAAEALYADGLDDLATSLAFDAARQWRDEAQLAAMAEVVKRFAGAGAQVQFAKIAVTRGYALDEMAFPAAGMPAYVPLAGSADMPTVYAVARQESEFIWRASSGAGAKGLMQMLPSTAAMTARRAGVEFDYARLLADPGFNTRLGAALLGQLIDDEGGSRELAFAAYNAGPGRVVQWIAAHGDPRNGTVDLVDWIERIPFDETRDYVERVSENLGVYRQRFADAPPAQPSVSARLARE